ncbi:MULTISPECIES: amino acid ABC transporter substrate-binding protein [unclassified Brenneria]|uniref:amino acid ABC transporter substrate-binding protein n=1 Tax=unclassified Brenneria TaxID=2634434 RepID=UPI0029C34660|nr:MULTISPECIES: amino acid ABC transporter substrate-binding protein [unclassified Brenneria]MDX5630232.1 amino acid ABC transporter substrate-binding protein [Brenneria sp. L3-3Z]MDX5697377.1 amino acid ABC transporter substrate-binding protein [Brenneria sp. L4-2C]
MCGYGKRLRHFLIVLFIVMVMESHASWAANIIPTLERIRQTKTIKIGYGDSLPFSYIGPTGEVNGYSIDLCKRIVDALRIRLGLEKINIEYVFRTPSNRVRLLTNGAIDIECDTTTNTTERRRNVAFSISHFMVDTRYVSLRKNHLNTLADLRGRSVSIVLGTNNVAQINQVNREKKLNLSIVSTDTLQKAFDMVAQEKVFAYAMDDVLLHAMVARAPNPQAYMISSEPVYGETEYGLMMRHGDEGFIDAVNDALRQIYADNEIEAIYARWFKQPLPGSDINLNFPMRDNLKQLFRAAGTPGAQ